jgi:hypothetical protein
LYYANRNKDGPTDIPQSVLIMKAYKEDAKRVQKFCDDFDTAIVQPRVLLSNGILRSIYIEGVSCEYDRGVG